MPRPSVRARCSSTPQSRSAACPALVPTPMAAQATQHKHISQHSAAGWRPAEASHRSLSSCVEPHGVELQVVYRSESERHPACTMQHIVQLGCLSAFVVRASIMTCQPTTIWQLLVCDCSCGMLPCWLLPGANCMQAAAAVLVVASRSRGILRCLVA